MSSRNVLDEISQIDSFLKQLRGGGAPPLSTEKSDEFQQAAPVATTAPPSQGSDLAQNNAAPILQPQPLQASAAPQPGTQALPPSTHPTGPSPYQASKLVEYSSSDSSSDGSSSEDSASTGDQLSVESDDSDAGYERDHFGLGEGGRGKAKKLAVPKVKGEVTADSLPPLVERLSLELPVGCELSVGGKVSNVVEELILIEGIKDSQPFDADTVLWNKDKSSIGKIFETFGPVKLPYYSVRKSPDTELKDLGISVGDPVFFVPSSDAMTKYVFTDKIQRLKGSDASWEHDIEPPEEHLEYSDDEEERAARRRMQEKRRAEAESEGREVAPGHTEERAEKKKSHKHKHKKKQHRQHHGEQHRHDYHHLGGQAPPPAVDQLPYQARQQGNAIYSQDPSMQIYFQGMTEDIYTGPLSPERVDSPLVNPLPHTAPSPANMYSSNPTMQNYFPRGNSPMFQAPPPMPGAGLMISGPPQGLLGAYPQAPPTLTSSGPFMGAYPWQQAPPQFVAGRNPALVPPLLPSNPNIQQGVAVAPRQPAPQSSQQPMPTQSVSPETEI